MKAGRHDPGSQLGFDALLLEADSTNHARRVEQANAHLPGTMEEALPFFWELLDEHHAAMLAGRVDEVMFCREEAHRLAVKLNGGRRGILADEASPGCVLARETSAAPGTVPAWGRRVASSSRSPECVSVSRSKASSASSPRGASGPASWPTPSIPAGRSSAKQATAASSACPLLPFPDCRRTRSPRRSSRRTSGRR